MVMHANPDFMLSREAIDALGRADVGRCGNYLDPKSLGYLKAAFHLRIREIVPEAQIIGVEIDSSAVELGADGFDLIQGNGQAPISEGVATLRSSRCFVSRFHMSLPELATAESDLHHGFYCFVQGTIPKTISLNSDLDPFDLGIRLVRLSRQKVRKNS